VTININEIKIAAAKRVVSIIRNCVSKASIDYDRDEEYLIVNDVEECINDALSQAELEILIG